MLIVPPLIGVTYGPLLGPAMLVAAGRKAGHDVELIDLNADWMREHDCGRYAHEPRRFVGDHDRPPTFPIQRDRFKAELGLTIPPRTHAEIRAQVDEIVRGSFGQWVATKLAGTGSCPAIVGVSVMHDEQVAPALAITSIARDSFPGAIVLWGGAHVTAMREEIARDESYGWLIDGFVFGYAEGTWVDTLDAIGRGTKALPRDIVGAGTGRLARAREMLDVIPDFGDLSVFDPSRLTVPLQASRGCSYGACAFCTYPAVEGHPRRCSADAVAAVIERACVLGASLSFKDSLADPDLLRDLAGHIRGLVAWSACTKLTGPLPTLLPVLARGGLHTLEIGLETIEPQAQRNALKKQNVRTFEQLLDVAERAGVALVINYITGFPNADREREQACMQFVQEQLEARSKLIAKLEHHSLQVERLAPFGRDPEAHGIEIVGTRPWSSVLEWRPAPQRLVQLRRSQ